MNEAAHRDLKLLVRRRWDPRVGMGKNQGRFEWLLGIVIVFSLFIGLVIPSSAPLWLLLLPTGIFYSSCFILSISWIYTRRFTRKRIEKKIEKHDAFICVWCKYPFSGLGDQGHCPECGAGYTKELCQRLFKLAFRKYTPSPQEFGKRESSAWREAIRYRYKPELIEPSPPPAIKLAQKQIESQRTLNQDQLHEVDQLVRGRIDPRKGVGPILGMTKYLCFIFTILMFFIVNYGIVPLTHSHGLGVFKWISIYVLFFVGFLVCWLIPLGIRKRTYAMTRKHRYLLCPWCRHGLSHLGEFGDCPGCGSRFRRSNCELLYQNAYRGFKPSKDEFKEREKEGWVEAIWFRDQES